MTIQEMKDRLQKNISDKKFKHSINVMDMSVMLAQAYKQNVEKAGIAGLLHDCARGVAKGELISMSKRFGIVIDEVSYANPSLMHARVGAKLASKDYGVEDIEIINAIACHTTGKANMNMLEKIVFMADCVSMDRGYKNVERMRNICFEDIDKALLMSFDQILVHTIRKRQPLHADTVAARNYLILHR